jgi:phosphate starvation-inducible protein PhoH and related proteins
LTRSYTKNILPLNTSQEKYLQAINDFPIIIGCGAAGGGKTFLAVYRACKEFEKFGKLILVRPAIATESLGYLPGDLEDKLDPYLRPLFDALNERWGPKKVAKLRETGEIEIAPLAFMRGRSFHSSFLILDEAQNTTIDQMKMFLTRLGEHSKCVITGDPKQSDIVGENGLQWIIRKLAPCSLVKIVNFSNKDIVRSDLVKEIIKYLE